MSALPEPAIDYEIELCGYVHLLNVYHYELKLYNVSAAHVFAYRNGAGWMLVNRWSDGSELILDYDSDTDLRAALDERLRTVQRTAAWLRRTQRTGRGGL